MPFEVYPVESYSAEISGLVTNTEATNREARDKLAGKIANIYEEVDGKDGAIVGSHVLPESVNNGHRAGHYVLYLVAEFPEES
jgi:hypothetical protein